MISILVPIALSVISAALCAAEPSTVYVYGLPTEQNGGAWYIGESHVAIFCFPEKLENHRTLSVDFTLKGRNMASKTFFYFLSPQEYADMKSLDAYALQQTINGPRLTAYRSSLTLGNRIPAMEVPIHYNEVLNYVKSQSEAIASRRASQSSVRQEPARDVSKNAELTSMSESAEKKGGAFDSAENKDHRFDKTEQKDGTSSSETWKPLNWARVPSGNSDLFRTSVRPPSIVSGPNSFQDGESSQAGETVEKSAEIYESGASEKKGRILRKSKVSFQGIEPEDENEEETQHTYPAVKINEKRTASTGRPAAAMNDDSDTNLVEDDANYEVKLASQTFAQLRKRGDFFSKAIDAGHLTDVHPDFISEYGLCFATMIRVSKKAKPGSDFTFEIVQPRKRAGLLKRTYRFTGLSVIYPPAEARTELVAPDVKEMKKLFFFRQKAARSDKK